MVMKRNMMRKDLRQTIKKSLGRYLAIVLIIALGSAMFVGLLATKSDMVATAQKFTDETNMFHLRLLSTYGWTAQDVAEVAQMEGVKEAEGSVSMDVIGIYGEEAEEAVYRLHSIPEDISKVYLLGGRMPETAEECLVDGSHADDTVLGQRFEISTGNDGETMDSLSVTGFTVVGYVSTPIYMDMSRGSTSLGSGDLANYIYIPPQAFSVEHFTEIAVTLHVDGLIYTDAFDRAMEEMADRLEPGVTLLAQQRFQGLKQDAQEVLDEGWNEYEAGQQEFETERQDALDALADALEKLRDGQSELEAARTELADAEVELEQAQQTLDENAKELASSKQALADAKVQADAELTAALEALETKEKEASAALQQILEGIAQLDAGIAQAEAGLEEIQSGLDTLEGLIDAQTMAVQGIKHRLHLAQGDPVVVEELEAQLSKAEQELAASQAQRQSLLEQQTVLSEQLTQLRSQREGLLQTQTSLEEAMVAIAQGKTELDSRRAEAEAGFAEAQAQIDAAQQQLTAGQAELDAQKVTLENGKTELEQSQIELDQGFERYAQEKLEAEQKLAEAEAELEEAKAELEDGQKTIDEMEPPECYVLDRNTNVGYLAVDNNSDIVAGVSRVFPVFFLLVAALVCITTMTRMVDEERTQIGIFKALGYGNAAIIRKYLIYTGSAAVIGCSLGVLVGSAVFPMTLWAAYDIILDLTPRIVLTLDLPLCIAVVTAYSAVSMLVTWYCCRRELREVPAELIRPKAPVAGKKIWMEHLPFWDKISFLNKVMFRNVFRYRQRLVMMLVGIGGCTALLLTGFGIGDSIKNIVDYQYEEVTVYDMEVQFDQAMDLKGQDDFRDSLKNDVEDVLFYHQRSADLYFGDKTRELYLICSDEKIGQFIDLHKGDVPLPMPAVGETLLSAGAAEAMAIRVGDTVTVRDADMKTLTLTVSGIFDNHVQNYVIVRPETIEAQLGEIPELQMAFVNVGAGQDVHAAGAKISGMDGVMNVAISSDIAEQVGGMLDALDMVVITVVVCAALLAAIVLYNLTNISITERVREIATIKVLGFTSWETAAYVFKENLLLSGIGSGLGLVGGIFLLRFVMSQIKIDMVWFQTRLEPVSFLWSVALTMLSACLVDLLLYFRLEKIHMAESLKSVE